MSTQVIFAGIPALQGLPQLEAVQHVRRLRGGSQAQLMRASDRQYWVVKMLGNAQHDRILANEFLASRLGQCLGLPVPDVEVIAISDWLIRNSPELRLELAGHSKPFEAGLHLASRFAGHPESAPTYDYLPEALFPSVLNRCDFAKILVLDKWTSNADGRQAVFTKLVHGDKHSVTFIDQGYSFNAGEWTFPDSALHGVFYRNYVYSDATSWDSFEPALTTAEEMDEQEIWECAAPIPSEWCVPNPADLPRLVEELYRRRSKIRELITAFRDSSRNPFPNWGCRLSTIPEPSTKLHMAKKEKFMFAELMPVIKDRPLTITVAVLTSGKIKVCVVPQSQEKDTKANKKLSVQSQAQVAKIPESAIQALTAPLALTGTPEELDASLAETLTTYAEAHAKLQHGIEETSRQIFDALKALEDRKSSKAKVESPKKDAAKKDHEKNPGHGQPDNTPPETKPSPTEHSGTLPLAWCAVAPASAVSANDHKLTAANNDDDGGGQ